MLRSIFLLASFFISPVFAQTDMPPPTETVIAGPHGGHVESAGSHKLELLFEKDLSLKVYLLDSDLKNETVKNSEVDIFVKSGNVESEMSCQPNENYFECKQNGKKMRKGELSISSKRDGNRADEIKVNFPFDQKPEEKKPSKAKRK